MRKKFIPTISIILITLSLGIYQAYLALALGTFFVYIFVRLLNGVSVKQILKLCLKVFLVFFVSLIIYIVFNKVALSVWNIDMGTGYQGIGENVMSDIGIIDYFGRVISCYRHVYEVFFGDYGYICEFECMGVILFIFLLVSYVRLAIYFTKKKQNIIPIILMLLLSPIFFDISYIMSGSNSARVQTSLIYMILFPIVFIDKIDADERFIVYKEVLPIILIMYLIFLSIGEHYNLYIINKEYERTYNYIMNKVINHPDYQDGMRVVVMGKFNADDSFVTMRDPHFRIHENAPERSHMTVSYELTQHFIKEASVYAIQLDGSQYPLYKDMNSFPEDGCIRKISPIDVLIKLSD